LIEYAIFLHELAQQWELWYNEIHHKGSLEDEDDARMSNTRIMQRKCTIPHSTPKTRTAITEEDTK